MASFVISDELLGRLSPAARREVVELLGEELAHAKTRHYLPDWDPEGDESYPLSQDEAVVMLRGMPAAGLGILRVFARLVDERLQSTTMRE